MGLSWRRSAYAATGSPRWWRRVGTDIAIRLFAVVLLLVALSTGDMSGANFWIAVAFAVMMATLLAIKVGMCVVVVRRPEKFDSRP